MEKGPEFVNYSIVEGLIKPRGRKQVLVSFSSQLNMSQPITKPIVVEIRGGKTLKIPFFAQSRTPDLKILQ